jgi:hypothetical protein
VSTPVRHRQAPNADNSKNCAILIPHLEILDEWVRHSVIANPRSSNPPATEARIFKSAGADLQIGGHWIVEPQCLGIVGCDGNCKGSGYLTGNAGIYCLQPFAN